MWGTSYPPIDFVVDEEMQSRARHLSPPWTFFAKYFENPDLPGGGERLYCCIVTETWFCEEDGNNGGKQCKLVVTDGDVENASGKEAI
jgi:hypothetical protein